MILLTCASLPDGISKETLLSVVSMLFSHKGNFEYLNRIANSTNLASANESLFALSLLYELICQLPRPVDTSSLIFGRSDGGKPYFRNSDIHFNVSHSHGYVACTVSDEGEVGIDIEASIVSPERAQKIADRYFNERERELVRCFPESFARIWCNKEAKAKFFGLGLGKHLENEKKSIYDTDFFAKNGKISIHSFYYDKIPISLCTKGKFGTITFV